MTETANAPKPQILIVDDHPNIRELLFLTLKKRGFDADAAEDGQEAVEKAQVKDYDLVVMDIHMPRMNGIEAAKLIKKKRPETYLVIMTGEANETEIHLALKEAGGHYACLRKPFDPPQFMVMVKHLLEEAQEHREKIQYEKEESVLEKIEDTLHEKRRKVEALAEKSQLKKWFYVIVVSLLLGAVISFFLLPGYDKISGFISEPEKLLEEVAKEKFQNMDEETKKKLMEKYKDQYNALDEESKKKLRDKFKK